MLKVLRLKTLVKCIKSMEMLRNAENAWSSLEEERHSKSRAFFVPCPRAESLDIHLHVVTVGNSRNQSSKCCCKFADRSASTGSTMRCPKGHLSAFLLTQYKAFPGCTQLWLLENVRINLRAACSIHM